MPDCRHCGFPLENQAACPKCQASREYMGRNAIYEVDVAHNGESWEQAKVLITQALDQAIYGQFKALKVIHGYGSLTGVAVIAPRAISLMRHLAEQNDVRFVKDQKNPGVSIIWLNKSRSESQQDERPIYSSVSKKVSSDNWFDQAMKKKF